MNLSFPVFVHINWKSIENAGEKMKKMKIREIFWNTKIHLSFQSSSAAALIKIRSDGQIIKFFGTSGHSFWIRANCRWFGQRGVEKKSHRTASFKAIKLLPCHFLATGMWNMYTVCPEEQFKVQTSLRKRKNYNHNWTNTWKFFEFWEKTHGVWAKNVLEALSELKSTCPSVFLRKVYSWGKNLISKISWISTKKNIILRAQRIFSGNLYFFPILWQNQDPALSYVWWRNCHLTQKFEKKPNFVYLIAEKLWKNFINATKSKKQMNLSFPVIVHINWKSIENAGEKMKKKWKSEKSFETPKFIWVFNLPPRQLWSKNCQTANL